MQTEQQKKKRRIASAIGAGVLAVVIAVTGTYAWQSISQKAKNVVDVDNNPGGRLHDDFNGQNKDVYVENFTDPEKNGVPIFIRVRLDEYMEIGPKAGELNKTPEEAAETKPLVVGSDINDVSTWKTHVPDTSSEVCAGGDLDTFHKYWSWDMGGETVYMPTYNKNKDSLKADINGTVEGLDGVKGQGVPYDDYVEYAVGDMKKADAVYDADDNTVDEGDDAAEGININTVEEEQHTAKATQTSRVMTMEEWKQLGAPMEPIWVYDVDGWAYWAEALQPGKATGLLLDGINLSREPDNKAYYGINAVGQFTTRGAWGDAESKTGFFGDDAGAPPTDDAIFLLKQAADLLPKVTKITIANGSSVYVKPGEGIALHANVKLINGTNDPEETAVNWSVNPAVDETIFKDGVFTPTEDMVGKTYQITATSTYNPTFSAATSIYVYPTEAAGVDKGENGKLYVDYGDNTFKEILADGTLGEFICAGGDKLIGNQDDTTQVVEINPADEIYGGKFIGPDYDYGYWAPGNDGKLGTADDVKVWGHDWPDNINTTPPLVADKVTVTTANNKTTVKPGGTLQFNASVTLNETEIERNEVTWSLSGATQAGTKIDENGLLTVDENEPGDTVLTITATAKAAPTVSGTITVKTSIVPAEMAGIEDIEPNSNNTVTIDEIEWYVLAKDGDKALLWSKEMLLEWGSKPFGKDNIWGNSAIREWLNGEFFNSLTTIKDSVIDTTLTTLNQGTKSYDTTTDKIFILSEADLLGTKNGVSTSQAEEFTYQGKRLISNTKLLHCSPAASTHYWERSPHSASQNLGIVGYNATVGYYICTGSYGIRPALWVTYK